MSTLEDIINETHLVLSGYTQRQDQASWLTADITSGALTISIQDGSVITRGLVEIDDELIWIDSFDRSSNTATVAPYGRGYKGTTAVAHTSGTRITIAPTFPRTSIERSINAAIEGVYPDLFGTAQTTFSWNPVRSTYALPATAIDVMGCSWQTTGPSQEWLPVRHFRVDRMANTGTFATGKTISITEGITPGRTVNVRYSIKPAQLTATTDVFEDVTGLPASAREVIVLGAAYRMAIFLDLGRVPSMTAEADAQGTTNPIGSAVNISRAIQMQYKDRLLTEIRRQQEQFPARVRITR